MSVDLVSHLRGGVYGMNRIALCSQAADEIEALRKSQTDLLEALEACLATLADERIGTWPYMEGVDIYSDFRSAANKARAAISKARGES